MLVLQTNGWRRHACPERDDMIERVQACVQNVEYRKGNLDANALIQRC